MTGRARCDKIIGLIDEALEEVELLFRSPRPRPEPIPVPAIAPKRGR